MNTPALRFSTLAAVLGACALPLSGEAQPANPPPPTFYAPPSSATYTQTDQAQPPQPPPAPASALAQPIDQLVAPIALYPDPLVALILPASVNAFQVVQANQYLADGGNPNNTASQPWDDSVRSLMHYPQLVQWMSDNPQWMEQLGATFASDPASVMTAIQQLRAIAVSSGTLVSTPQQQVIQDNGQIEIEPATQTQIYVPSYDPNLVFVDQPYASGGDYISFGDPWVTGAWLGWGFNWEARALWYGDSREWHGGGGHGFREFHGPPPAGLHAWHPPANRPPVSRAVVTVNGSRPVIPHPMRGVPPAPQRARGSVTIEHEARPQPRPAPAAHPTRPAAPQPEARPRLEPNHEFHVPAGAGRAAQPTAAPAGGPVRVSPTREPVRSEMAPRGVNAPGHEPQRAAEPHAVAPHPAPPPHPPPRPAPPPSEGREKPQPN